MESLRNTASLEKFETVTVQYLYRVKKISMTSNVLPLHFAPSQAKGQLISKAIYCLLSSSKKRTDKFVLFLFYSSLQTNQVHPFVFWENLQRANLLFEIN